MIINKVSNTKKGIKYGLINKVVSLALPFLVQATLIRTLGIKYVGLKGLFTSLLSILSLMELGFGSAIAYSMYKPVADDDTETLGALLNYYKKAYQIIGFAVLIIGCTITPFLKYLTKDDCPADLNIYVLFLLYLCNTVISYWCFAYKASLLNAYQRTDILSRISTVVTITVSVLQILVLLFVGNYYLFIMVSVIGGLCSNLIVSAYVDKMFPNVKCVGTLSRESLPDIRKKTAGVFIGRVCHITRYSFDTIFLSTFYGLTQTALYTNYFAVINALNGFTGIITGALLAGVGNNIALYSKEKNYADMIRFDQVYLTFGGWMTVCLICLYQPFMALWIGEDYLLPVPAMMLFAIYFYVKKMTEIRGIYASAAGLFWEDKNRNIIEAAANILLNYLLVRKFAVAGVMFATLLTFCTFGYIGSTRVIFKNYFKFGKKEYFKHQARHMEILVAVATVTGLFCWFGKFESTLVVFLYRFIICVTIAPLVYWLILRNCKAYPEVKSWIRRMLKGSTQGIS